MFLNDIKTAIPEINEPDVIIISDGDKGLKIADDDVCSCQPRRGNERPYTTRERAASNRALKYSLDYADGQEL